MKQCNAREHGHGERCAFLDGHGGAHGYPAPGEDLTDRIRWRVAADERARARLELDAVYRERNACVAFMARMAELWGGRSWIAKHPPDPNWDPEWMNIVFITFHNMARPHSTSENIQLSWHIHDSEMHLFSCIPTAFNTPPFQPWDGHTTGEKYERMAAFCRGEP